MWSEKINVSNVEIKNLKYGFPPNNTNRSGIIYFNGEKVVTFVYTDDLVSEMSITIHNKELEEDMVDFQKNQDYPIEIQTVQDFIDSAVTLHTLRYIISLEQVKFYIDYEIYSDTLIGLKQFKADIIRALVYEYSLTDTQALEIFRQVITEIDYQDLNIFVDSIKLLADKIIS